ncbi:hypothetical protein [Roseicyclus persicicus]|uniref:Uncharacterized protein n=1 Tax=Roseicyclus persicicus TaxID=2650661 RepID=A0A7X6JZ71_9RHOB|nr:hypothetical protein [Roseibacterium persicicum]NKX44860.1 hypothetical protein [Roseibacterium persicicum]
MLSRRDFLAGTSAVALAPHVERILEHHLRSDAPLLSAPARPERILYIDRDPGQHGFQIVTDALPFPRRLVKYDVIENAFGEGGFRRLTQRDHWRLIDEGRFRREDTFQPCFGDGFYAAWLANHSPAGEAAGLLLDLGLGPETDAPGDHGLRFEGCDDDDGRNPAVCCESPASISLLRAVLDMKACMIEVRFQQRPSHAVTWDDLFRNGGNVSGI